MYQQSRAASRTRTLKPKDPLYLAKRPTVPEVGFGLWFEAVPVLVVLVVLLSLVVPLIRLASSTKAAKLLGPDSTALMENTIPAPQWLVWPQYPQIGAVCAKMGQHVGARKTKDGTNIVDRDLECREISRIRGNWFAEIKHCRERLLRSGNKRSDLQSRLEPNCARERGISKGLARV